jgi:hypothetical protein
VEPRRLVIRERIVPVVLSVLVIVVVAIVQERSRGLAAIIATMPLTAPLAMWIVYTASHGDERQTAEFVGSMVMGFAASLVFVLACWFGFRHGWSFAATLAFASAIWVAVAALPPLAATWIR